MSATEPLACPAGLASLQRAAKERVLARLERDKADCPPLAPLLASLQVGLLDADVDVNALLKDRPNPDTLMIRFHHHMGESLGDYLEKARLEVAVGLLCATEMTCKAIAEHVGYASESSFSRAFRRRMTLTAGEFKKNWQAVVGRIGVPDVDIHDLKLLKDLRRGVLEETERIGILTFFESLSGAMGAFRLGELAAAEPAAGEPYLSPDELKARLLEMIADLPHEDQQAHLRAVEVQNSDLR